MARWEEAHDALLDLYRFHITKFGENLIRDGWVRPNAMRVHDRDGFLSAYGTYNEQLKAGLFNSDPIFIDADMMTLIEAAAEKFQPERIVLEDLPTMAGFAYFPRSVTTRWNRDMQAEVLGIPHEEREVGLMAAQVVGEQVMTRQLTRRAVNILDDPMPLPAVAPGESKWISGVPRVDLIGGTTSEWRAALWQPVNDGRSLNIALFEDTTRGDWRKWIDANPGHRPPPALMFSHTNTWPLFDEMRVPNEDEGPWYTDIKFLQVLWRLMAQTISIVEPRMVGGQFKGRAQRANFEPRRVTVVTLRRPEKPRDPEATRTVEWTHQWITSGHWRRQWYPSLGIHRQIWISPFVKGPADLPLVLPKVRAFQLVR